MPKFAAELIAGRPVVALESTIISHGMPWPQNVETELAVEAEVRARRGTRGVRGLGRSPEGRPHARRD
jgi:pseudouridine-5'-phosphate glycosidase